MPGLSQTSGSGVNRQQLIEEALQVVEYDCSQLSTVDLQEIVNVIHADQAPAVEAPRQHTSVRVSDLILPFQAKINMIIRPSRYHPHRSL
jgi:hypothetical protein